MPAMQIEDAIRACLTGGARENALEFTAYLRAKGLALGESESYWEVRQDGKTVCALWVDAGDAIPGPWTIWSAEEPDSWAYWREGDDARTFTPAEVDGRTKEIAWANLNRCGNCGGCGHPGGKRKTVLGKDFDALCNAAMQFVNPDADAVACAKTMVDVRVGQLTINS